MLGLTERIFNIIYYFVFCLIVKRTKKWWGYFGLPEEIGGAILNQVEADANWDFHGHEKWGYHGHLFFFFLGCSNFRYIYFYQYIQFLKINKKNGWAIMGHYFFHYINE